MLKMILAAFVVALLLLLLYATTRPDTFRVERAVLINAPADRIFPLIDDLRRFNTWNPYAKKDPAIKGSYAGPASGPGAAYSWESDEVGTGLMEITETSAPNRVAMKLDFIKPFEAHNMAEFTLAPSGDATQVSWVMAGPAPFMSKLAGIFINMDKMVGKDFESGLQDLKAMAESR